MCRLWGKLASESQGYVKEMWSKCSVKGCIWWCAHVMPGQSCDFVPMWRCVWPAGPCCAKLRSSSHGGSGNSAEPSCCKIHYVTILTLLSWTPLSELTEGTTLICSLGISRNVPKILRVFRALKSSFSIYIFCAIRSIVKAFSRLVSTLLLPLPQSVTTTLRVVIFLGANYFRCQTDLSITSSPHLPVGDH